MTFSKICLAVTAQQRFCGNMTLDASFNRGGDQFLFGLPDRYGFPDSDDFEVRVVGSTLEMRSSLGTVAIPVGTTGLTMTHDGTEAVLRYADGHVLIGQQIIGPDWLALALAG